MGRRRDFDADEIARPGSLQGLMARYLADLERRNYSAETTAIRRLQLLQFADWLAERGVTDAAAVTRPMAERYQRWLFAYRDGNGRPLTVGYQIQRVKPLQMLFRWAVKKHRLPANPASDLDYPRPIKRLPDVLTMEEAEKVLAVPDTGTPLGLRDRAILELLYSTGMRRMECCNLRRDDVDHRHGLVRINQGKGKKDRIVPVGARALDWLARYETRARPFLGPASPDEPRLFLARSGRPLGRGALTVIARNHLRAAGIEKAGSCHIFRHTMATAMHAGGCDVRVIQELLGHAKLDTTALYTHVGVAHLKAAHAAFHPAATAAEAALAAPTDDDPGARDD